MAFVINQEICTCCHRCEVECPVGAVRYRNAKHWIDPGKCISCGTCAAHCHNNAITDPNTPPEVFEPHELLQKTCDVLVIGGGAAGLAAAARAADLGKKVIVLEKNREPGGCAWYAHMIRVHYSKWHEQAGLPDKRERIYERFMKRTEGRVNGDVLKRVLKANADLINWLIEKGDLASGFELGPGPFGTVGLMGTYKWEYNEKKPEPSIGPGNYGWYFVLMLERMLERAGGEILCSVQADHLLTDSDGKVIGSMAHDPGGPIRINAPAVIVTAGTFTRNREIMAQMEPRFYSDKDEEPIHVLSCSTCTGDGITMCREISADIDYQNRRVCMWGPAHAPFHYSVSTLTEGKSVFRVDKNGARLTGNYMPDEASLLVDLPGRICWCIVDSRTVEEEYNRIVPRANGDMADTNRIRKNLLIDLESEIEDGAVVRADTLSELAGKLGMPADTLKQSYEDYRKDIAAGKGVEPYLGMDSDEDSPFEMPDTGEVLRAMDQAPFYAILEKMFHENALGGMVTDGKFRVLKQGVPIEGLYAAGDNIRGIALPGRIGVRYVEGILSALTFALNSGFAAGEEAVAALD